MSDEQQLLAVLLNKGITPNFSFPLDACQFSAVGVESFRRHVFASMTQDLRKALREYSPGKEISVDGKQYTVGGLSFFKPSDRVNQAFEFLGPNGDGDFPHLKWYSRCIEPECGWVYGKTDKPYNERDEETGAFINSNCPLCGSLGGANERGIVSSRWYRPEGFAPIIVPYDKDGQELRQEPRGSTKIMKPQQFGRRPSERTSSGGRVELPAPLVSDGEDDEDEDENEANLEPKTMEHSPFDTHVNYFVSRDGKDNQITKPGIQLILMNTGFNGRGFWTCQRCGRTEVLRHANFGIGAGGHHRPYQPHFLEGEENRRCQGPEIFGLDGLDRLMFGMTFRTDMAILRVSFDTRFIRPEDLARNKELDSGIRALKESLLTEINKVYEFEDREISAGFRKWIEQIHDQETDRTRRSLVLDLFFYDEVPGGAGLSTLLFNDQERWNRVIEQTEQRLSGDSCSGQGGCDSACVGCLLDFRNGQDHNRMNRKNGLRLLRWLMDQTNLPSLENGDKDPASDISLSKIKDLFDIRQDRSIEIQDGVLIFKENGTSTFNLRPVSSLIRRREQPFYVSDWERFEENVEDGPELGGETDDDDSETIFYFPMMEISDSVVRLEQRIFGEQILF